MRRLFAATVVAAVLAVSGCSSDEPAATDTEDTFLDSMESACRAAARAINGLRAAEGASADLAAYLSTMLDSVDGLQPPASMDIELVAFASSVENLITQLGKLDRAVRNGDQAARQQALDQVNSLRRASDEAAKSLGASACVGLTPTDGLAPPTGSSEPTTTVENTTTTIVETTVPETTVPDTIVPETTAPETTAPATTLPATTTTIAGSPVIDSADATRIRADSIDACGKPTSYEPDNLIDGERDSAWMAEGDATGVRLTFELVAPAVISRVGLVPGYDKFDPCTNTDRFFELRRVTEVRWTFDDGTTVEQTLDAGSPAMQYVQVPAGLVTGTVTLTILSTVEPGVERLDHTPISEVSIL